MMGFEISRRAWVRQAAAVALSPWLLSSAHAQTSPRKLRVVASFSILADMAREVGGDAVEVTALVGPDGDAHVFEPTPADVKRLSNADLVIVNGLRFEGWIERLIQVSGYRGPVVVASQGITTRLLGPTPDPHAWQSLANARRYVDNIRAALVAARPAQAAAIERRSADYLRRVDALDASVRARLGQIAPADRRVVTSHDAFGYFAEAYGVTFISAIGWSTGSEASAADVSRIVRQLKAQNVRAVFVENITDARLVQRIAHEAGARVGGTLYSDALSPPGTSGDSYLRMFEHNASTLLAALQARVP
jgi:zinc/manganese transport system substrate-binding protein